MHGQSLGILFSFGSFWLGPYLAMFKKCNWAFLPECLSNILFQVLIVDDLFSLHILLSGQIMPWVSVSKNRTLHRVLHSRQIHQTNWCVLLTCVGGWTTPSTWSTWSSPSRRTWRAKAILDNFSKILRILEWKPWSYLCNFMCISRVFRSFHVNVSIPLLCRELWPLQSKKSGVYWVEVLCFIQSGWIILNLSSSICLCTINAVNSLADLHKSSKRVGFISRMVSKGSSFLLYLDCLCMGDITLRTKSTWS